MPITLTFPPQIILGLTLVTGLLMFLGQPIPTEMIVLMGLFICWTISFGIYVLGKAMMAIMEAQMSMMYDNPLEELDGLEAHAVKIDADSEDGKALQEILERMTSNEKDRE